MRKHLCRSGLKVRWHQNISIEGKERKETTAFGRWSTRAGVPHVSVMESLLVVRIHLDDCANRTVRFASCRIAFAGAPEDRQILRICAESAVHCTVPAGGLLLMPENACN
jgi:hypothetical protein